MQTSYVTAPGAGSLGELEDESAYPNSTTSWFFLDALDVQAPPETGLVVCFGDSITDGTGSTLNGDDRWPDVLPAACKPGGPTWPWSMPGIGGNQVVGPAEYSPAKPFAGGPSALSRLDRDVLGLVRRHPRDLARGHQRLQHQRQRQRRPGRATACAPAVKRLRAKLPASR